MALQPLYKGLGKAEFEGGEVKKDASPPPLSEWRGGVITDFATVINGKNKILRTIKAMQI